jgi:antitoxin HigA-1
MKTLPNIHPGEILLEECLLPMNVSQNELARATGVPPRRINQIVIDKRSDLWAIENIERIAA